MQEGFLITVALCTHNHVDRIMQTLTDLGKLESPEAPWELLVIDNGCTDGTSELLNDTSWQPADTPVRIVREEKLGLSNARNCAIRESRGDYLIFVDDDETPDPQWLRAYEHCILTHKPDAIGGKIDVLIEHGKPPDWLQDELLGFLGRLDHGEERWLMEPSTPFYGGNFSVRRCIFDNIGNFDADLGRKGVINAGGEDTDFYRRLLNAGHTVRWLPSAVIYHRILADKLRRGYFLDLHYHQGRIEGSRKRGSRSCIPPRYLFRQLLRAGSIALGQRLKQGKTHSLRMEMNFAYFLGYLRGWVSA